MIRLARALPGIAVMAFDLRCATPVLPVATAQHVPSAPRSLPKATRQQTASTKIPIASDARPRHTSRGFLPWRFAYAGPGARSHTFMGAGIRKPSQKRKGPGIGSMSASHLPTDMSRYRRDVRKVPNPEVALQRKTLE